MISKSRKLKIKNQKKHNQNYNGCKSIKTLHIPFNHETRKTKLLEVFVVELSSRLGLEPLDFIPKIQNIGVSVRHLFGRYIERKITHTLNYYCDDFKLIMSEYDEKTIELWWIEVFNKGKGLGSDILNKILCLSDELGIGIRIIPVDIDNKEGKIKTLYRLRNWYKSFGLKSRDFNRTPVLYYEPQIIELRQVS